MIVHVKIRPPDFNRHGWRRVLTWRNGNPEIGVGALGEEDATVGVPRGELVAGGKCGEGVPREGFLKGVVEEEGGGGAAAAVVVEFCGGQGEGEVGRGKDGASAVPGGGVGGGGDEGCEDGVAAGLEGSGGGQGGRGRSRRLRRSGGGGGRSPGEEAEEGDRDCQELEEVKPSSLIMVEIKDCHFCLDFFGFDRAFFLFFDESGCFLVGGCGSSWRSRTGFGRE